MKLIIKESVDKVYDKFNQFKKNGYEKIQKMFRFKKNNSFDTELNENFNLEYNNNSLEYYSDISDDEYDSYEKNFIFLDHKRRKL
jgi:hypothetical protein